MKDQTQLNEIVTEFDKRLNTHSGVGAIMLVFNDIERFKRQTAIAVLQKGVKTEDAVLMLRQMADNIERAGKDESRIILPTGPTILKSSRY